MTGVLTYAEQQIIGVVLIGGSIGFVALSLLWGSWIDARRRYEKRGQQ